MAILGCSTNVLICDIYTTSVAILTHLNFYVKFKHNQKIKGYKKMKLILFLIGFIITILGLILAIYTTLGWYGIIITISGMYLTLNNLKGYKEKEINKELFKQNQLSKSFNRNKIK